MASSSRREPRTETLANRLDLLVNTDLTAALRLAATLVAQERAHRVLEPALELLTAHPSPDYRPALRDRFADLTDNGMRYDQDCSLRVKIVQLLRLIGSADDVDIGESGVRLIQLNPPSRVDVAQALRGQCLLLLADVAPTRAPFYAVELLHDPHLSSFSGEPAVTAIQVLAEKANILPIWALARRSGAQTDVLAQAFASLRQTPADLQLDALLMHLKEAVGLGNRGDGVALVAAEAIVLNHLIGGYSAVFDLLRDTTNLNLYGYLVITAARFGDDPLSTPLLDLRNRETGAAKVAILAEIFGSGGRSR